MNAVTAELNSRIRPSCVSINGTTTTFTISRANSSVHSVGKRSTQRSKCVVTLLALMRTLTRGRVDAVANSSIQRPNCTVTDTVTTTSIERRPNQHKTNTDVHIVTKHSNHTHRSAGTLQRNTRGTKPIPAQNAMKRLQVRQHWVDILRLNIVTDGIGRKQMTNGWHESRRKEEKLRRNYRAKITRCMCTVTEYDQTCLMHRRCAKFAVTKATTYRAYSGTMSTDTKTIIRKKTL